jgi:VanZ family protein
VLFLCAVAAIFWAALQPALAPSGENQMDKLAHVAAFGFMASLGWVACSRLGSRAVVLLGLVCLGVAIEVAQGFVPGRYSSRMDILANLLGIGAGASAMAVLGRLRRLA